MDNDELVELFISPLRECISYKPRFGNSSLKGGCSFDDFLALYRADPFYSWIGLDSPLMYGAHKAAGGMTSIYRQIGIGCERLFRQIVIERTGYKNSSSAKWSYTTQTKSGKSKTLSLDARLELRDMNDKTTRRNVERWIGECLESMDADARDLSGAVFEVRQGYKSKDSKRQNADLDNATVAYSKNYLPVFAVFSSQIDDEIALRYRNGRCGLLVGRINDNPLTSLYAFCEKILGFDLASFFKRNSPTFHKQASDVLSALLETK